MVPNLRKLFTISFLVLPIFAWEYWSIPAIIFLIIAPSFIKSSNTYVFIAMLIGSFAIHSIAIDTKSALPLAGFWGYSIIYFVIVYVFGID